MSVGNNRVLDINLEKSSEINEESLSDTVPLAQRYQIWATSRITISDRVMEVLKSATEAERCCAYWFCG